MIMSKQCNQEEKYLEDKFILDGKLVGNSKNCKFKNLQELWVSINIY